MDQLKKFVLIFFIFAAFSGVSAQENVDEMKDENNKEAAEAEQPMELDNIIVSATREESTAFQVPNSANVVDNEEITRSQATTIYDVLDDIPNVDFENSSIASIQRASIRGLGQDEIIIKVDGVRQTYQAGSGIGAGSVLIDPSLLKEVEVVRGPSSVLHGSGGIGGVISMETVDAADLLKEGKNFGTTHRTGYTSSLGEFSQTVSAYGRYGIADLLVSGSFRNYGEYKSSDPDDDYDTADREGENYSGFFKMSLFPSEDQDVTVSVNTFNDDMTRNITEYGSEQQRINASYNIDKDNGLIDFHANSQYVNRVNQYDNGTVDYEDDFNSFGIDMYNNFSGAFTDSLAYDLTVGGDASFDHQEGTNAGEPDTSRPDADATDFGMFARLDIGVFDQLHIIPAARYSYYSRKANNSVFDADDQKDSRFSPQFTVQWVPFEWLTLYGSSAETFRAPTMDDIYFEMDYSPYPISVVANPDLKPEIAKTYEAGLGLGFNNVVTADDAVRLKAVLFTETVEDFISASTDYVMNGGMMEYTNINTGEVKRTGFELDSGIRLSNYSVDVAYGIIKGEDQDSDDKTGSVPQNISVTLGADVPRAGLAFYWKSKYVDESDYTTMAGTDSVDAYNVHGAGAVWVPAIKSFENYRLDLSVNNIFDEEYKTYRGSVGPARDVRVSCTASF